MKWLKRITLGLIAIVFIGLAVLYGWSGMILGKKYEAEARTVLFSSDPAVIERGERLAQVFGCFHGCHGADMEGNVMVDKPLLGRLVAPNLTQAVDKYDSAELEAIIRQGILPDGTSVKAMPSDAFSAMTDEDLTTILSFIKDYPRQENDLGTTSVGPIGRFALITGLFPVPAEGTQPHPWEEGFRDDPMKLGEYLAILACAECHGPDFQGRGDFTPPLTIAKAYSPQDFRKLMSTGIGLGDRDLGLMTQMGEFRLKHLTDDEVAALYTFLQTL